ncbi:MAG: hypothetical protein IPL78_21970 [Chloroflexi bacterium]|nr:hypothetical protein [Chloroflexota bacterium]
MRQMTAWVTDTNDQPLAEAEVQIQDEEGNVLVSGRTNALGVFKTPLDPAISAPYLVVARQGDDVVITGLDYDWQNYGYGNNPGYFGDGTLPYASTVYTDRPIYRPGHTVYYKAIIRSDNDAILDLIPAGTAVQVRIADARNNTIREETLYTNSFGTINGSFTLAEGAMLGNYRVVISLGEYSKSQVFKVEDYRKPEYEVILTTDSLVYTIGDTLTVQVAANYYFGEPVANATVSLNFYEPRSYYYDYYNGTGYNPNYQGWRSSWNQEPIHKLPTPMA